MISPLELFLYIRMIIYIYISTYSWNCTSKYGSDIGHVGASFPGKWLVMLRNVHVLGSGSFSATAVGPFGCRTCNGGKTCHVPGNFLKGTRPGNHQKAPGNIFKTCQFSNQSIASSKTNIALEFWKTTKFRGKS